jgi:hypothetical protein
MYKLKTVNIFPIHREKCKKISIHREICCCSAASISYQKKKKIPDAGEQINW